MIRDPYLANVFQTVLRDENLAEQNNHVQSYKLTAGILGDPLQWQILKIIGVPAREFDDYTLGVFARGRSVEEFVIEKLKNKIKIVETQKEVEYKGAVGFADMIVDTSDANFKAGIIPFEIKSVKNSKFKRIMESGEADSQHKLQAAFYAMALGAKHYAITYVAADDLRIETFVYPTIDSAKEIDAIISRVDAQLKTGIVPIFEAVQKWQEDPQYCKYPNLIGAEEKNLNFWVKTKFPEAYKKLLTYKQE